jgi:hypothetical protein
VEKILPGLAEKYFNTFLNSSSGQRVIVVSTLRKQNLLGNWQAFLQQENAFLPLPQSRLKVLTIFEYLRDHYLLPNEKLVSEIEQKAIFRLLSEGKTASANPIWQLRNIAEYIRNAYRTGVYTDFLPFPVILPEYEKPVKEAIDLYLALLKKHHKCDIETLFERFKKDHSTLSDTIEYAHSAQMNVVAFYHHLWTGNKIEKMMIPQIHGVSEHGFMDATDPEGLAQFKEQLQMSLLQKQFGAITAFHSEISETAAILEKVSREKNTSVVMAAPSEYRDTFGKMASLYGLSPSNSRQPVAGLPFPAYVLNMLQWIRNSDNIDGLVRILNPEFLPDECIENRDSFLLKETLLYLPGFIPDRRFKSIDAAIAGLSGQRGLPPLLAENTDRIIRQWALVKPWLLSLQSLREANAKTQMDSIMPHLMALRFVNAPNQPFAGAEHVLEALELSRQLLELHPSGFVAVAVFEVLLRQILGEMPYQPEIRFQTFALHGLEDLVNFTSSEPVHICGIHTGALPSRNVQYNPLLTAAAKKRLATYSDIEQLSVFHHLSARENSNYSFARQTGGQPTGLSLLIATDTPVEDAGPLAALPVFGLDQSGETEIPRQHSVPNVFSASSLQMFLRCPWQYHLSEVEKIHLPDTYESQFGRGPAGVLVHSILETFGKMPDFSVYMLELNYDKRQALLRQMIEKTGQAFEHGRFEHFILKNQFRKDYLRRQLFGDRQRSFQNGALWHLFEQQHQRYLEEELLPQENFSCYTEVRFEKTFPDFRLKGFVDRIDDFGPAQVAWDYKTGSTGELQNSEYQFENIQREVYHLLAREQFPGIGKIFIQPVLSDDYQPVEGYLQNWQKRLERMLQKDKRIAGDDASRLSFAVYRLTDPVAIFRARLQEAKLPIHSDIDATQDLSTTDEAVQVFFERLLENYNNSIGDQIQKLVALIRTGENTPLVGQHCTFCQFKSICDAYQKQYEQ